jgi:hypothetical protein
MPDIAVIGGVLSSLQSAGEIAKSLIGLRDTSMIQGKVIELQSQILAAQTSAMSAQSDQFALVERIRALEKQIADLEAWDTEKKRYSLAELCPGVTAYLVKPEARGSEPIHALCANCYQHGHKSILQWQESPLTGVSFQCHGCKAKMDGYGDDNFALRGGRKKPEITI